MSGDTELHPEAKAIEKKLRENSILTLYHFTDISNLPLIRQCGGLWSKAKLEEEDLLDKVIAGGKGPSQELDRRLENWDKVHLSFCPHTPMSYYIQQESHLCYLKIDYRVALRKGVVFTDTNATRIRDRHQRKEGLVGLDLVDFGIINSTLHSGPQPWSPEWRRKVQAETLVPNEVPLSAIIETVFISQASQEEGERLWGEFSHPLFKVDKNIFASGIPYVESTLLTKEKIDQSTVSEQTFSGQRIFDKSPALKISLLVFVYASAELKARVVWKSSENQIVSEDEEEFPTSGNYWQWSVLDAGSLPSGDYAVQYFLKDTLWATIPFCIEE